VGDITDYADVLAEPQRRIWEDIASIAHSRGGVLMGGTAVAVHLRHRISEDLDIMTLDPCPGALVAMQLGQMFADFHTVDVSKDSCRAIVDGVRVDVFTAPRRPSVGEHGMRRVADSVNVCGMPVGSLPDLLATKLEIIQSRSKLRDYIDLYAIDTLSGYSLEDGIGFYCHRYGHDRLPHSFGDTITRLADPQTLPTDPMFSHLQDHVLDHLSSRAADLRRHAATQYALTAQPQPPGPPTPQRSSPQPTPPEPATADQMLRGIIGDAAAAAAPPDLTDAAADLADSTLCGSTRTHDGKPCQLPARSCPYSRHAADRRR
jgi:hypothetical protein